MISDLVRLEDWRTRGGLSGGYGSRVDAADHIQLCSLLDPDFPGRIPSHARDEPLEAFIDDTRSCDALLVTISLDRRECYLADRI